MTGEEEEQEVMGGSRWRRTNRKCERRRLATTESATQRLVKANHHVTLLVSTWAGALQ